MGIYTKRSKTHTGRHFTFPVPSLLGHFHPLGHGVHCSWPPHENVPAGQFISVEVLVDGQYLPPGQTVHDWAFPTEYVPKEKAKTKSIYFGHNT